MRLFFIILQFLYLLPTHIFNPLLKSSHKSKPSSILSSFLQKFKPLRNLNCSFDEITFCKLINNGGWSFKQSLLDLVHQLTRKDRTLTNHLKSQHPDYYVCSDWGVTFKASENQLIGNKNQHQPFNVAILTSLSNQKRVKRASNGKVLYAGPLSSNPYQTSLDHYLSTENSCLCLSMDVRLSSDYRSKLLVHYKSVYQTIGFFNKTEHPVTSSRFLDTIYNNTLWPINFRPGRSSYLTSPPSNQWMSLKLPISSDLLQSNNLSNGLTIHGYSGVCINNLALLISLPSNCIRGLFWINHQINNNIYFNEYGRPSPYPSLLKIKDIKYEQQVKDKGIESVLHVDRQPHFIIMHQIFTASFFFALIVSLFLLLFIVVFVISVACGKRPSLLAYRKRDKKLTSNLNIPPTSSVLSLSTLTTAEIDNCLLPQKLGHLEKFYNIGEQMLAEEEEEKNICSSLKKIPLSPKNWIFNKRHPYRSSLPSPVVSTGPNLDRSSGTHIKQHKNENRKLRSNQPSSPVGNNRLSLLLSINEENELVLVPQDNNSPQIPAPVELNHSVLMSSNAVPATSNFRHLSDADAEATLQEMAASVGALGDSKKNVSSLLSEPNSVLPHVIDRFESLPLYEDAVQLHDKVVDKFS